MKTILLGMEQHKLYMDTEKIVKYYLGEHKKSLLTEEQSAAFKVENEEGMKEFDRLIDEVKKISI